MRILTVGLDGADWGFIKGSIQHLPTFKKILETASGELQTVIPPISAAAWTSFATGSNPAKTDIYDFVRRDDRSYRLRVNSSQMICSPTFWETLSEHGMTTYIMNVPTVSWPPQAVHGIMISGLPAPRILTYPPDISERVKKMGWQIDPHLRDLPLREIPDLLIDVAESRFNVVSHFIKKKFNFFIIVFTALDRAQHFLLGRPGYEKDLLKVYMKMDEIVGKLIQMNELGMTVLLSDHGSTPINKTFHINDWLIDEGLLSVKKAEGIKSIEELEVNWNDSLAYSYGEQGKIWLNVKGREPKGCLNPTEYEKVRDEVISTLIGINDHSKKLDLHVWKKEELYHGPYFDNGPDIIFMMNEGTYNVKAGIGHDAIFTEPKLWSADHTTKGIYAFIGDKVKASNYERTIYDLAPTILSRYNIRPKEDIDGKILNLFDSSS